MLQRIASRIPPAGRGIELVRLALAQSGQETLPSNDTALRAFLRHELREVLAGELGPRLGDEILRDVEDAVWQRPALRSNATRPEAPVSRRAPKRELPDTVPPPSSAVRTAKRIAASAVEAKPLGVQAETQASVEGRQILVLDRDRIRSSTLARALVRERVAIATAHDPGEAAFAIDEAMPAVLVVDERGAADLPRRLHVLLRDHPEVGVVVHGATNPTVAEATLRARGAQRIEVLQATATMRDIVAAVVRLARVP